MEHTIYRGDDICCCVFIVNYLHTETNRELSKLMDAKGCKSEALHKMNWYAHGYLAGKYFVEEERLCNKSPIHPAFTFEDCVRPDNARLVWGEDKVCYHCGKQWKESSGCCEYNAMQLSPWNSESWQYHTYKLLDAFQSDPTGEAWMMLIIDRLKV